MQYRFENIAAVLQDQVYPEYRVHLVQNQDQCALTIYLEGWTDAGQRVVVQQLAGYGHCVAGAEDLVSLLVQLIHIGEAELAERISWLDNHSS